MRITTQMINEGARKTGLPIHGNSLLNYIEKDTANSLLSALNKNISETNAAASIYSGKKSDYEKLEKTAEKLLETTEYFTTEGETTIFSQAKESGDKQEIYNHTKSLLDTYNSTIKLLKSSDSVLDMYYKEMFDEVISENKAELESIGVTISSKGNLSVDEAKMKEVDVDTLEKVLGTSGAFSSKIGFLASRVSANAESNANSYSSRYSASGDMESLINHRYDWWG